MATLAEANPALASQWHPTLNGELTPNDVTPGVNKLAWWTDECGHAWTAKITDVTHHNSVHVNCVYCTNKRVLQGFNDFATTDPELAKEVSANSHIKATEITSGTLKKLLWDCPKGHEYLASIKSRKTAQKLPCPSCTGITPKGTKLADANPALAAEWHPTLNGELTPADVATSSFQEAWWLGAECGHTWNALIRNRVNRGSGCPYCAGQKILVGFNDLGTTHPLLAAEISPNSKLQATEVTAGTDKKPLWLCSKGHEWEAAVGGRVRGRGCIYCTNQKVLPGETDLAAKYPEVAKEWHPTRNGDTQPNSVMAKSRTKYWWLGEKCGHEWLTSVSHRVNGTGCPICSRHLLSVGINDFATTHPALAAQVSPTSPIKATQVTAGSEKKLEWVCDKGHGTWMAVLSSRVRGGHGCPKCSGHKVVTGETDVATTHPQILLEWADTTILPTQVSTSSARKVLLKCTNGHYRYTRVADYTKINSYSCSKCKASGGEKAITAWLEDELGIKTVTNTRRIISPFELDIYLPDHNVAIEFNGLYWHSELAGKDRFYHQAKWEAANKAGIQLIQIWEDDWNANSDVIKNALAHKLGATTKAKHFARKLVVTQLNTTQAKDFLEENHIQGYASGSYYLGLTTAEGETVAVLVLKKETRNTLNIIRYATSAHVVGGFTKLLRNAEKAYQPDSFITFADHTISNGGLYENNGFTADKELPPDYMYIVKGQRKHKFGYRLKRFKTDPELLWEEGLTEKQLAKLNKIPRIWDAGKTRYRLNVTRQGTT